jgi:hypothetical protein
VVGTWLLEKDRSNTVLDGTYIFGGGTSRRLFTTFQFCVTWPDDFFQLIEFFTVSSISHRQ